MTLGFRESFQRDLQNLQGQYVLRGLKLTIRQLEAAESLSDIGNLKQLNGHKKYFAIALGNYRLGLKLESNTAVLIRLLHYRELMRYYNK